MHDRARLALILTGVAAVLGGAVYVIKVHLPNRERRAAQAEIEAWEKRLTEARTCLFGDKPASASSAEALSVNELTMQTWNGTLCSPMIGNLTRAAGDVRGEDTGIPAVEQAWEAIDKAATRAATAFITHVDPMGEKFEDRGKLSPLPAALQELDTAHAALRAAAGMSPPHSVTGGKLAAAELIPISEGGEPVTNLDPSVVASAGGAIIWGEISAKDAKSGWSANTSSSSFSMRWFATRPVTVVASPGAAPKVARIGRNGLHALPDLAWGAQATPSLLAIGPVDAEGAIASSGSLIELEAPTGVPRTVDGVPVSWTYNTTVYATAGKLGEGTVAFGFGGQLAFARATGGGAFALADKPVPAASLASTVDVSGRAAVAWSDEEGALTGALLVDGSLPKSLPIGSGRASAACLTKTHAWAGEAPQFVRFDAIAAQPHVLDGYALHACNDTHALFQKAFVTAEYSVCAESCRPAKLEGMRSAGVSGLVGDRVVGVLAHRGVLGVWSETRPPAFYSFAGNAFEPTVAHSDGKVLDVVGLVDSKAAILRVPAR